MDLTPLTAISPVDGRYALKLQDLRADFSEAGLIARRIRVQSAWLMHLSRVVGLPALRELPKAVLQVLSQLAAAPPADAPASVKALELRINHDVKAVEYYVRERLTAAGAEARVLEFVHFACTSEDINNLSYACMLRDARGELILPGLKAIIESLREIAHRNAATTMLARTHGQPASPTTLGKEIANFVVRLERQHAAIARIEILGKFNGATGNYNAHRVAVPDINWPAVSRGFVESLGLGWNSHTTQIEPHDWIAELCDALARSNTILIGMCRDVWSYISIGYFRQRVIEGEVGSSTMPHKVNPIDFENAEGNFGIANALLRHFSEKLPISRWQRDLTDSTVLRNLGVALAHTLIAEQSLTKGLGKLEADAVRAREDLDGAWEVLGEALQTVMRAHGIGNAYEQLKNLSRGQAVTRESLHAFIDTLKLPAEERRRLKALTPAGYTGYAQDLAQDI